MLPKPKGNNIVYIDRIYLINHLIDYAEKCGVKFIFGGETISAVYSKEKVTGIRFCENGCVKTEYADLVIDAAGFNSPVRKSLPPHFGIQKEISYEKNIITTSVLFLNCNQSLDEIGYKMLQHSITNRRLQRPKTY